MTTDAIVAVPRLEDGLACAALLRQVALVGYGTRFLRGELPLEDWYRHGIFRDARLQFRAPAGNALLADDFTLWLEILRQSGARRLTLHRAKALPGKEAHPGNLAIVVHFADSWQTWTVGKEYAAWQDHPLLAEDTSHRFPVVPNAAGYAGDVDGYWCGATAPGRLDVPGTDWKALGVAIAADLDIAVPSPKVAAGPFYHSAPEQSTWARLPLFPDTAGSRPAHRLVATLAREQATFANDTHPKNENSYYKNLDDAGAAQADDWGRRLDGWMTEVLLHSANECGQPAGKRTQVFASVRPVQAEDVAKAADAAPPTPETPAAAASPVSTAAPATTGKWARRLVFAVAFALASLSVLALANTIANFPWLALLAGLPCALYLASRYRSTMTSNPP